MPAGSVMMRPAPFHCITDFLKNVRYLLVYLTLRVSLRHMGSLVAEQDVLIAARGV